MSSVNASIEIRSLEGTEEFGGCVDLQLSVWGFDPLDVLPLRFFVVASQIGGQVFGAFTADSRMVGFLCALPGMRGNLPYLHSQMLAVIPEFRNRGIAWRLKLAQRQDALQRGYQLIEWTFDPLELKNAYFNIEKLGVVANRYSPNQYGLNSSRLQAGLPTDRMFADWWIQSGRVREIFGEKETCRQGEQEEFWQRIEVPTEVMKWKNESVEQAREVQERLRKKFLASFSSGYWVTHFERGKDVSCYILSKHFNNQP